MGVLGERKNLEIGFEFVGEMVVPILRWKTSGVSFGE
jgi:hypothetical protein